MEKRFILLTALTSIIIINGWAQNRMTMTNKKVKIREDKVEINYYVQGKADTALLFLHGWSINSAYWKNQIEYFSKDYSVYAIDLPGFGESSANRENWTIEDYAKDVLGFIETMNLRNVILIGHSMSGDIVLETSLANNSRVSGLIGIDNFKFVDVEFTPEQMEQITSFFPLLENDFEKNAPLYADMVLFHTSTSLEVKNRVKHDFAMANPQIGYSSFINAMRHSREIATKLEQLQYKLHLINSSATPTNKKGLENRCKNGFSLYSVGETGHYPMIEKPEEFNKVLEKVLQQFN